MSNDLSTITADQLRRAITIKERIEALTTELNRLLGSSPGAKSGAGLRGRKMSAAGRAAIAAGQKARWAKAKGGKVASKGRRKMSAAGRARISAAAKARWKAAKAAGKTRL